MEVVFGLGSVVLEINKKNLWGKEILYVVWLVWIFRIILNYSYIRVIIFFIVIVLLVVREWSKLRI